MVQLAAAGSSAGGDAGALPAAAATVAGSPPVTSTTTDEPMQCRIKDYTYVFDGTPQSAEDFEKGIYNHFFGAAKGKDTLERRLSCRETHCTGLMSSNGCSKALAGGARRLQVKCNTCTTSCMFKALLSDYSQRGSVAEAALEQMERVFTSLPTTDKQALIAQKKEKTQRGLLSWMITTDKTEGKDQTRTASGTQAGVDTKPSAKRVRIDSPEKMKDSVEEFPALVSPGEPVFKSDRFMNKPVPKCEQLKKEDSDDDDLMPVSKSGRRKKLIESDDDDAMADVIVQCDAPLASKSVDDTETPEQAAVQEPVDSDDVQEIDLSRVSIMHPAVTHFLRSIKEKDYMLEKDQVQQLVLLTIELTVAQDELLEQFKVAEAKYEALHDVIAGMNEKPEIHAPAAPHSADRDRALAAKRPVAPVRERDTAPPDTVVESLYSEASSNAHPQKKKKKKKKSKSLSAGEKRGQQPDRFGYVVEPDFPGRVLANGDIMFDNGIPTVEQMKAFVGRKTTTPGAKAVPASLAKKVTPPMPGNEARHAWRKLNAKPLSQLSQSDRKKILAMGQARPRQSFLRTHIAIAGVPNETVHDARRRMGKFLDVSGLRKYIKAFSNVGKHILEIYHCEEVKGDVERIIRAKQLRVKEMDPSDFSHYVDIGLREKRREQAAKRLGYLLAREHLSAMEECILAGYDERLVSKAREYAAETLKMQKHRWVTKHRPADKTALAKFGLGDGRARATVDRDVANQIEIEQSDGGSQ